MKIIATTVIRHSVVGSQVSGRIIELDWPKGKIISDLPVPDPKFPKSNTNPRGGLRGGRGVKTWCGNYYVANYDTIFVYNPHWQLINEISHPLSADIHEIDINESGIWLSCSRYDLVIKLDFEGNLIDHWHIHDSPDLCKKIGIESRSLDMSIDYREKGVPEDFDLSHLNCVQIGPDNTLIINLGLIRNNSLSRNLLGKFFDYFPGLVNKNKKLKTLLNGEMSYIVQVSLNNKNDVKILGRFSAKRPNHNGMVLYDDLLILAGQNQQIFTFSMQSAKIDQPICIPGNWLRGLAKTSDSRIFVGKGPAGIVEVDLCSRQIVKEVVLSDNKFESVHGLMTIAS